MESGQEIAFVQKLGVNDLAELKPCTWGMDGQLGFLSTCENLYHSAICSQVFDFINTSIYARVLYMEAKVWDEFIATTILTNRC